MSDAEHIEAKAAEWLVRWDASHNTNPEFTAWLASDPRHRAAYLRLAAAWERTAQLKRLRPEEEGIDPDLLALRPHRRWTLGGWRPLALAAGVAAVGLSAIWWMTREPAMETYRTDVGGLSRVVLTDGSTVTLNTDTELRVRLLPERREITLVHGEAQFAVAHDADRPFEVSAGGRVVRAVGTAFDVRLEPDSAVQVIVTEGRVAVESASGGKGSLATVSAGESAVANAKVVTIRHASATETSRRLAWQAGELSFQGESLSEAVAEFNRYNHRKLKVDDPAVAALQVGGNFQTLDVDSFVAAVERSFNLTAKTADDGTLTLERSAGPRR